MQIECPNWHPGSQCCTGDTSISGAYPEALTTTIEGLSKEEKRGMQKLADEWNEEGPPDEQRESSISFFQTAHFDLLSIMYQKYLKPSKVMKKFLADIKRTMGVQAFMMVGYIGKMRTPIAPCE